MDLSFSEEQAALVEAFGNFFRKEVTGDLVRDAEPGGFHPELWDDLAGTGALAIGVHESDLVDAALFVELAGRAAAPIPVVESLVAARALQRCGDPLGSVERLVAGSCIGTVALHPAERGTLRRVPAGAVADVVLAVDHDRVVLLDGAPPVDAPPNLGASPLADRVLDPASSTPLGADPAASLEAWRRDWRVLTAAALVGLAAEAISITTDYAGERRQFDRPIGSFQAIAHDLVDAAVDVEGARLLAHEAAWAVDAEDERATALAIMALRFAAEAAERATTLGVHVHGGYGFMLEYDVQLLYRRAKVWPAPIGTPEAERQRLADSLWPHEVGA